MSFNSGWTDFATKIIRFLGKFNKSGPPPIPSPLTKSYRAAASIVSWPEFSQPMTLFISPNPELIKKWFISRWKVTAGFKATPLDHNKFLFEFPSRQEAIRVKAGEWFWNGRHLSLSWWSKNINSQTGEPPENIWLKVFGIPLNAWTMDTFEHIGDRCGGFIGVDEDTKNRSHFLWARICVKNSVMKFPASLNFEFAGWLFDLALISEIRSSPLPTGQNPELARVGKLLGTESHSVPRDIRFKNPREESVDKRKGKSYLNFNINDRPNTTMGELI
uniref:DUF4283 domain-containing protein n=1 Tax=Solanum lycopersicum TaxID=4081 RepID=K4CQ35_SOLLC